jgi:hypothetical protein
MNWSPVIVGLGIVTILGSGSGMDRCRGFLAFESNPHPSRMLAVREDDPPKREDMFDPSVVVAFQQSGARHGCLVVGDHWLGFVPQKAGACEQGLPAFMFRKVDPSRLVDLPEPGMPFGLEFWWADLNDAGLKHVAKWKQLRMLNIRACRKLSAVGLGELAHLPHLQTLQLSYCDQLNDEGLAPLANFQHLQWLSLNQGDHFSDAGCQHLAKLGRLRTLSLDECGQVGDTGLKQLAQLQHLQALSLWRCKELPIRV